MNVETDADAVPVEDVCHGARRHAEAARSGVGDGVLLGASVTVLGPVSIGTCSKVGAGSVVNSDIPAYCVAVGVPARIVKRNYMPPNEMDQCTDFMLDYVI